MAWEEREGDLEEQLNKGAAWAVTYGDLMSYLVIFFMLLYSAMSNKSIATQMDMQAIQDTFNNKKGKLIEELFSKHGVQQIAKIEMLESRMRIIFLSPVLFESGSA